jgi:NADPH:quinone reductase-like Zn-dependent oxidoreductase
VDGMRVWTQDRYGGPEVVREARVPVPEPGPRDVVVRVEAVALNAADAHLMRSPPPPSSRGRPPFSAAQRRRSRSGTGLRR